MHTALVFMDSVVFPQMGSPVVRRFVLAKKCCPYPINSIRKSLSCGHNKSVYHSVHEYKEHFDEILTYKRSLYFGDSDVCSAACGSYWRSCV